MRFEELSNKELKRVVALQYDGSGAPVVSAKGSDATAEAILALAAEHDIPLCENPALLDLLSQLELGEEVPEALYKSVAYVLAFAYELVFAKEQACEEAATQQPKNNDLLGFDKL
ncbi:EscU/YscU/HrcU family type III secretion system export apparatus switch protein [Agaribacterium sp. ZY112]|uniref:EscU/YscU/HrcU family type III secretion system export apparatus switch protein n=1 Tax=Agaribacterium sp. ZY112 TaxID=3233574 RepID=UPI0035265203